MCLSCEVFFPLFYSQMHSIFYIMWYCNKHLQKGLILLFFSVRICLGHSQYLHPALVSDLFGKSYLNVIVCVCRSDGGVCVVLMPMILCTSEFSWYSICLQISSHVPQMIQRWSSQRSRLPACARSSCRPVVSSILPASSTASPLFSSTPALTPRSWRACWRPTPPSPFTRAASPTCTPCWRASPSPPAASRSCSSSGSGPTTPRPRGRGDVPWELWGSTAWGESFLFLALSGMERRRATVSRL